MNSITFPISSLQSICIDFVVNNLHCLLNEINAMKRLPYHIKDKILHKISVSLHFWAKVDAKLIWNSLIHRSTKHVNLTFCLVDDELLRTLSMCHDLRELYLTQILDNPFTTKGLLELIPCLKELHMLTLSKCSMVNDDVIIAVAKNCLKLKGLDLHSCINVTDAALFELVNLEHLRWVTLSNTKVSNKGVEAFVKGSSGSKLSELRLGDCVNVTGQILPAITANCPKLEVFVFHGCKIIQDSELLDLPLKGLKQFQYTIEW